MIVSMLNTTWVNNKVFDGKQDGSVTRAALCAELDCSLEELNCKLNKLNKRKALSNAIQKLDENDTKAQKNLSRQQRRLAKKNKQENLTEQDVIQVNNDPVQVASNVKEEIFMNEEKGIVCKSADKTLLEILEENEANLEEQLEKANNRLIGYDQQIKSGEEKLMQFLSEIDELMERYKVIVSETDSIGQEIAMAKENKAADEVERTVILEKLEKVRQEIQENLIVNLTITKEGTVLDERAEVVSVQEVSQEEVLKLYQNQVIFDFLKESEITIGQLSTVWAICNMTKINPDFETEKLDSLYKMIRSEIFGEKEAVAV